MSATFLGILDASLLDGVPPIGRAIALLELSVNLSHVSDEVENFVRVTDLIVVPANHLNEGVSQSDTCLSIEDRCAGVTQEVA